MPSISVPIGNNFYVNASFGLGISPNGIVAGTNFSGTYHDGDFSLTGGFGVSDNSASWGGSATYEGYGLGFYKTTYGNAPGLDSKPNPQTIGAWDVHFNHNSIRIENDRFGDKLDRWRTSAVEVRVGNFVIGKNVYTNSPDRENIDPAYTSKFWDRPIWNKLGINATRPAYKDGISHSSPLYIGVRHGNRITRLGVDHPVFQDVFQNGWHILSNSPFFYTPYGANPSAFRYSGYYNPYSLYY